MGFSTCSMVVDDVHFHLFLFSLWLNVIVCDDIEWMRMNGSCLLKDENELDNLLFLFFSAMMKTNKEWNLIRFVFHVCRFRRLLSILAKRNNRHSFWIVNWESVVLIKLVEMIEISTAFAKYVVNLFGFSVFFSIWGLLKTLNVERGLKSACSQQLVKFEKERTKSVIFRICQTGWNSLAIGLAEWLKLVAIKQTTISTTTELDFLLLLSTSERNAVFSSFHPIFLAFLEWLFREQEHLKRGNEMKWKSTCCLQISSVEKWSYSIINVVLSEFWNV